MAKRKRLTKKQRKRRNNWLIALLLGALLFISGYIAGHQELDFSGVLAKFDSMKEKVEEQLGNFNQTEKENESQAGEGIEGTSEIHLFDVGQGSSILLIAKDGSTVLIDTGRYDDSEKKIISYLDKAIGLGGKIDLLIFSHNDSDHIGHGDLVLEYFDVQEVWMNGLDQTTKVYANLLDSLLAATVEYQEPKAGETFVRESFELQVLHPEVGSTRKDHNDESIVVRIAFDGISLITSGDASIRREKEIVERTGNLKSDILILGHHGADNSTGDEWIAAVEPEMAFYQAGKDNIYDHPGKETMQRLQEAGVPVYGTKDFGTISLYIDENGALEIVTDLGIIGG